jgi:hypothetical protein
MSSLPVPPAFVALRQAMEAGDEIRYRQLMTEQTALLDPARRPSHGLPPLPENMEMQKEIGEQLQWAVRHRAAFVLATIASLPEEAAWSRPSGPDLAIALAEEVRHPHPDWVSDLLRLQTPKENPFTLLSMALNTILEAEDNPVAIQHLLACGLKPRKGRQPVNDPLYMAVTHRRAASLQALLPVFSPWKLGQAALLAALEIQSQPMIDALLPLCEPNAVARGLGHAAMTNRVDLLEQVLNVCQQQYPAMPLQDELDLAFTMAADHNVPATLNRLAGLCDPNANQGEALRHAVDGKAQDTIAWLVPRTNLDVVEQVYVQEKKLEKLVDLTPWVSEEKVADWAKQYGKKVPALQAAHRAREASRMAPDSAPPERRRRFRA